MGFPGLQGTLHLVDVAGIEPASQDISSVGSTCLSDCLSRYDYHNKDCHLFCLSLAGWVYTSLGSQCDGLATEVTANSFVLGIWISARCLKWPPRNHCMLPLPSPSGRNQFTP